MFYFRYTSGVNIRRRYCRTGWAKN